jgi:iron complex transport system substrate-binding protein
VGDAARVDFERIVALKPDLVLARKSGNSAADAGRLESLGYPAFVSEPAARRLRLLRAIGALAGTAAASAAAEFERKSPRCAAATRWRARCGCSPDLAQAV